MTTFKQFLESENPQTLKELINKMSPGYLGRTGGQIMYRGMKNIDDFNGTKLEVLPSKNANGFIDVYKIKTRTDRKPRDSSLQLHTHFDSWFEKEFGHKFRSAGVFASSSPYPFYGDEYAIFPIGKWSYVWSPNVPDLTDKFSELYHVANDEFLSFDNLQNIPKSKIWKALDNAGFTNNDLDKALGTKNEIIIDCDSYLAIRKELLPSGTRWLEN